MTRGLVPGPEYLPGVKLGRAPGSNNLSYFAEAVDPALRAAAARGEGTCSSAIACSWYIRTGVCFDWSLAQQAGISLAPSFQELFPFFCSPWGGEQRASFRGRAAYL